jgi:NAD(P)-dependent dehydrogenase (short-subunit alcohol dehydrogenase family)
MCQLDGRIAIVSGAAGGLGQAAARRLATAGAQIGIIDIADAGETQDSIRAAGGTAEAWRCDVTDDQQVTQTFARIGERFGHIDILVNNAGLISPRIPWYEHTKEQIERFIDVNYIGYFLVTKAAYPLLKQSRAGRVINVASRTFFLAGPGQLGYVASKGAVIGMTRVLAREMGEDNITVNAVMPGQVATPGTRQYNTEEAFDRTMQNQAIKKRGMPEHLAALIAFLASDGAEMITGQTIICDGGGYMH